MKELLIEQASVYDGTGEEPVHADVLARDGRITAVGAPGSFTRTGREIVCADGLSLAPGFIDAHSHSDMTLLAAPEAFGKVAQGVTTEILGNCGLSLFPCPAGEIREHLQNLYTPYGLPIDWTDLRGYANAVLQRVPAVNFATLCGHNTLRASVMGYDATAPSTTSERNAMKELLTTALDQGALGISTGLLYVPGKFASTEELLDLMGAMRGRNLVCATHLRSESAQLEESVDEAIRLAEAADARLQISHLKTALEPNWHKLGAVLARIREAKTQGVNVHADRYPYVYGQTSLSVILPNPYESMTDRAIQEDLRSDSRDARTALAFLRKQDFWDKILLTATELPAYTPFLGMTIREVARACRVDPAELTFDLLRRDAVHTMAAFGGLSEDNLKTILAQDFVVCGTDENARPRDFSLGRSHPRGFGSFPRFLRMVRAEHSMAEAVRRCTGLTAQIFGLKDRGRIAPGLAADLVLFDEDTLADAATFRAPHRAPDGIRMVFVNGVCAYFEGAVRSRNGRFLSR